MKAPRLNRRLTLEAPQRVADGAGGFSESWVALGEMWAEVAPRTGRERSVGGTALSSVAHRITVRAAPVGAPSRPEVNQRFREGSRLFLIEAVVERDPDGRFLTCFAQEETVA